MVTLSFPSRCCFCRLVSFGWTLWSVQKHIDAQLYSLCRKCCSIDSLTVTHSCPLYFLYSRSLIFNSTHSFLYSNYSLFLYSKITQTVQERLADLQRLKARRNELNAKVRMLREELYHLQEPGSYVGEVVKQMGQNKVLVKINPEGKYVVDLGQGH